MTLDLAKLKEAAEKATQGRWWVSNAIAQHNGMSARPVYRGANGGLIFVFNDTSMGKDADATYIALANPATILALIERLESAEDALEPFAQAAEQIGPMWHDYAFHLDSSRPVGDFRRASAHLDKYK